MLKGRLNPIPKKNYIVYKYTKYISILQVTWTADDVFTIPTHVKVKKDQESDLHPLLLWNISCDPDDDREPVSDDDNLVFYMALKHVVSDAACDWSHPVRLLGNKDGVRMTISVPGTPDSEEYKPLCITGHERGGISYFVIREDNSPVCLVQNMLDVPLYYGHQNKSITEAGALFLKLLDYMLIACICTSTVYFLCY